MRRFYWPVVTGLVALLIFVSFFNLGTEPIQSWDEARHGVSAYEMMSTGDYVLTTYRYKTDYWNLKPPLTAYIQILGYRIFGTNSYGLRFFSALFYVASALMCAVFAHKHVGRIATIIALLGFAAVNNPILYHCARTGDPDAYLMFAVTWSLLSLLMLEYKQDIKWLYLACGGFAFGFLVKSWHAGIIALTIIGYLILHWRDRKVWFSWKRVGLCLLCAFGPILIWMSWRFSKDGLKFFQEMIRVDLLNRSATTLEGHAGDLTFYPNVLTSDWCVLAMAIIAAIGTILARGRRYLPTCWLAFMIPLVLFSFVQTKLIWYIYVAYPPLILLSAICGQRLFEKVTSAKSTGELAVSGGALIVAAILMLPGFYNNVSYVVKLEKSSHETDVAQLGQLIPRGVRVYSMYDWQQSDVLLYEWAGDFVATDGGLSAWSEDENGYLVTDSFFFTTLKTTRYVLGDVVVVGHEE